MGWFASGKSTAARFFAEKGFYEIDADQIGKEALKACAPQIVEVFGQGILKEGIICPKKLGGLVFENEANLLALNAVVHPWMREKIGELIQTCGQEKILINAAILPQLQLIKFCDQILMIDAPEPVLIERGMTRNGFSKEKVCSILEVQKKYNDYFKTADFIIQNHGSLKEFYRALESYAEKIGGKDHDASGRKSGI